MTLPRPARPGLLGLALALAAAAPLAHAGPQSNTASQASEASLIGSVEVPLAVVSALAEGASFAVTAVAATGGMVALTVSAVGVGASFVVYLSAEAVSRLAISAGTVLVVVAVSGGWLLVAGSEAICFIADETSQSLFHSGEAHR